MKRTELEDFRTLAGLVAELIHRMGASYGSRDDWRRDFTEAVQIQERACVALTKEGLK